MRERRRRGGYCEGKERVDIVNILRDGMGGKSEDWTKKILRSFIEWMKHGKFWKIKHKDWIMFGRNQSYRRITNLKSLSKELITCKSL